MRLSTLGSAAFHAVVVATVVCSGGIRATDIGTAQLREDARATLVALGAPEHEADFLLDAMEGASRDGRFPQDIFREARRFVGPAHSGEAEARLRDYAESLLGRVAGPVPMNNGTCLRCPLYDFEPFTPTSACQYHSESTDAANDCNMYLFNVTAGVGY